MKTPEKRLRLWVTRRDEPDVDRLVELVLNIAEARYQAQVNGKPDPYEPPPSDQATARSTSAEGAGRGTVE